MRNTTAYYLLIFYTFALCKPVVPLLIDKIAHIFWQTEHIASVHHHHGNHHTEQEIAASAHEEETNSVRSLMVN